MSIRKKLKSKLPKTVQLIGGLIVFMYAPRKEIAEMKVNRDIKYIKEELKKLLEKHK
ncbi:MAG: hypothetical protein WCC74_00980 [Minisyncoccia bacterium]